MPTLMQIADATISSDEDRRPQIHTAGHVVGRIVALGAAQIVFDTWLWTEIAKTAIAEIWLLTQRVTERAGIGSKPTQSLDKWGAIGAVLGEIEADLEELRADQARIKVERTLIELERARIDNEAHASLIVQDPNRCGGAPTLSGTRIGVHNVVSYAMAYNQDLDRVHREALPHLTREQINAAMAWYDTHQEEIDTILRRQAEQYERGVAAAHAAR